MPVGIAIRPDARQGRKTAADPSQHSASRMQICRNREPGRRTGWPDRPRSQWRQAAGNEDEHEPPRSWMV